jgi:transposase
MGKEKYPLEIKLAVVKYVLDEQHTQKEAAERYGVSLYPVEKWVNLYRCHGAEGLKSRNRWNQQQHFTGEIKLHVLEYMKINHLSYTQTAAIFCIDVVTVSKWDKLCRESGVQALLGKGVVMDAEVHSKKPKKEPSTSEMKQLQEENRRLRMENDYLKKLNALIQEKEKSATNNG